jgi:hypothetical protein
MPYHPRPISYLGPKGPLDDIGFSGWYGCCHVLFSILHVFQYYYLNIKIFKFYENWNFWKKFKKFKSYENF